MDYYRDTVTQESWKFLESIAKTYRLVLIGGWAVWLYTHRLKSKDIDIVVDLPTLGKLKADFTVGKNDRLRKYEIRKGPLSVDIYVEHWSVPGIPAEEILKAPRSLEGFRVPQAEMLLVTKHVAYLSRQGSSKGRKDLVDIVSLLTLDRLDWRHYHRLCRRHDSSLPKKLKELISGTTDVVELELNRHQFSRYKKIWLEKL